MMGYTAGSSDCIMSLRKCAKLSASTIENVASVAVAGRPRASGSTDFCMVFPEVCDACLFHTARTPAGLNPTEALAYEIRGGRLCGGRFAELGLDELMVALFAGPFECGDIRSTARAPAQIG